MSDRSARDPVRELEPVHVDEDRSSSWTDRLLVFLRVMAGVSMIKGLSHWAIVCGFTTSSGGPFEAHPLPWQTATVFFAVIDLVAAVGLWLAAPWGAVVWLTASVSMIAVQAFFPQIYGGQLAVVLVEAVLICAYLLLAILAAREQPP
jgi:uncharacterized membrane protein (DUF2068 family)